MIFLDSETVKVKAAAIVGFAAPGINLFLKNLEPVLNTLILIGQIGVAGVSILYIYSKYKKVKSSKTRRTKKKDQ